MFADDCVNYRVRNEVRDIRLLQADLDITEAWCNMNVIKC